MLTNFGSLCCSTEIVAGFVRPSPRCAGSASRSMTMFPERACPVRVGMNFDRIVVSSGQNSSYADTPSHSINGRR